MYDESFACVRLSFPMHVEIFGCWKLRSVCVFWRGTLRALELKSFGVNERSRECTIEIFRAVQVSTY